MIMEKLSLREIYDMLYFQATRHTRMSLSQASIFAIKNTVKVWKEQYEK